MEQDEFDGIIIGGGHNGLTVGAYLSKAGMKILVLDRRGMYGGAAMTEEAVMPGVYHNMHACWVATGLPPYRDLELERYGVVHIRPPILGAFMYDDGRAIMTYRDTPSKTLKDMEQFSGKDAKTMTMLAKKYGPVQAQEMYSPPKHPSERGAGLEPDDRAEYQKLCQMSPRQVANELFESDQVKVFFCVRTCLMGTTDYYEGTGDLIFRVAGRGGTGLVRGGTRQIAHGLGQVIMKNGGTILNQSHVERVIVKDGQAQGVEMADGRKFFSRKFVASSVDIPQTFLKLIGRDNLDKNIVQKAENWKHEDWALFGTHLVVKNPPKYQAKFPPEVNQALMNIIGYSSLDDLDTHWEEIKRGEPPANPGGNCGCHTVNDPTYGAPGLNPCLFWQFAPTAHALKNGASWDDARHDYLDRCIERWKEYAPNLTPDNIAGKASYTPLDITRRIINMLEGGCRSGSFGYGQYYYGRPFPECNDYRTPIEGMYLCGAGSHPGGAITFAPGYNCTNVIAEDFGIKKWWPPFTAWTSYLTG